MGAGAVGCYVGGRLARVDGVEVVLVGRPWLREQVAASGLSLVDLAGREHSIRADELTVETSASSLAGCDVVLCCVKSGQTDEVGAGLAGVLGPDAVVVSLQNGVRNAERLRARLAGRVVLAGIVGFNVVARDGGGFRHTTVGALMVERTDEPRGARLVAAMRAAGLEAGMPSEIERHQWAKLLVNLSNAVSALSGAPTRDMVLRPGYRRIVAAVMGEGYRVLRAAGIRPASLRGIPVGWLPRLLRLPTPLVRLLARAQLKADPEARSSMFADLDRRRTTEVDDLNGEIVRLAERAGVEAPLNARLVQLIREAEVAGAGSPCLGPDAFWAALTGR